MTINLNLPDFRQALTAYLGLIQRFHKLTEKEIEVAVELVNAYLIYLKRYQHPEAAAKLYMETESREKMIASLKCTDQVFRNYLNTLKKKGVLKSDLTVSKALIPDITKIDNSDAITLTINISYAQEELNQGHDLGKAGE